MNWHTLRSRLVSYIIITLSLSPSLSHAQNGMQTSTTADPAVSPQALKRMGFVEEGSPIGSDDYVQLMVAVVVPRDGNTIKLNKCPKKGHLWNISFDGLVEGDKTTTLGMTISGPVIPASTYAPITMTTKPKWIIGGSSCVVEIDPIQYRSPLFGVRRYETQAFKVEPVYSRSSAMSEQIRADVSKLALGIATVSGVSALSAGPYLSTLDTGLKSLGFDNKERISHYFPIRSGVASKPEIWEIPDALTSPKGKGPPLSAFIVAQLIPVATAISKPNHVASWRPGTVLNAPYRTSASMAPGSDTLSAYLYSIAGKEIDDYNSAPPAAADQACKALANKVDAVGLSEHDSSLAMWAISRSRVDRGFSTEQQVDALSCMRDRWDALKLAGIEKSIPSTPISSPDTEQMKRASYIDDDLATFFVTESWDVRKTLATRLFAYPTAYTDTNKRMMLESTTLEGREGWAANAFGRDRPLLTKLGCYAYFEGTKTHPFAELAGQSIMVAFGELPSPQVDGPRQEVMLQLNFAPTPLGERARLNGVILHENVSEDVRLDVLSRYSQLNRCNSGYRPKLLFGS